MGVAAAPRRLPRPGSHLVSGAGAGRALRAVQTRVRTRTRTRTRGGRRRPRGGRQAVAASCPGSTWQPPAGSGGGRLGGGGGGGGERRRRPAGPGPAQPSALPRPDTAPGAEMADEPQKKPHLSALVGHTNGLTKPVSLAATATRSTGGGGGSGGATASSKKLVIKNFRGGYGAGRALCPGRCARPELCLLRAWPLPAPCPRPGPAAVTRPAAVSGRGAATAGLIALPAPCP